MALTAAGNTRSTTFDLNGRETTVVVQPRTLLSDTIRHTVGEPVSYTHLTLPTNREV